MANDNLEVLADAVTVHKEVGVLTDPISGNVTGRQNGVGSTYLKGDVIARGDVTGDVLEALEDSDHPSHESVSERLRFVSDDPDENAEARLGSPFAGYEDMDADEVVAAMRHLPSATVRRIQQYEEAHDGRPEIVEYVIGYGEANVSRQAGDVGGGLDDSNEDKVAASLTTREVPEDGAVEPGEGITGTGDPQIPHGSAKKSRSRASSRKGRRSRQTRSKKAESGDGDQSGSESSDE